LTDVRARPIEDLRALVGSSAEWLRDLAQGHDPRAVNPNEERKSVGSECTYEADLEDLARIRAEIDEMARDAARWLEKNAAYARTVVIKVRYDNFDTITRSQSDARPTRDPDALATRAVALLEKTEAGRRPIRLLGVSVHNLEETDAPPRPKRGAADGSPRLPLE
jgi:DNA polymerase-4